MSLLIFVTLSPILTNLSSYFLRSHPWDLRNNKNAPQMKEMRHAQHGTKERKKKKCRGMAWTGPGQMIGSSKTKLKSKTPLYRQDTWFYARGMKVAWCGKRVFLRAIEIQTDVSIGWKVAGHHGFAHSYRIPLFRDVTTFVCLLFLTDFKYMFLNYNQA